MLRHAVEKPGRARTIGDEGNLNGCPMFAPAYMG